MKGIIYVSGLLLGVILTLHLAMIGKVGAAIGNPRVGNAVFCTIGALTAILIGAAGWREGILANLKQVNPILFSAVRSGRASSSRLRG